MIPRKHSSFKNIGCLATYTKKYFPKKYEKELKLKKFNENPGLVIAEEFLNSVKEQLKFLTVPRQRRGLQRVRP